MEFDQFTIVLKVRPPDAPELDDAAAAELQDAHLAHLARLRDEGYLLAAGPTSDERIRGISVFSVPPERAAELQSDDPAVQAGRLAIQVMEWMVPKGAVSFGEAQFPRGIADVEGD